MQCNAENACVNGMCKRALTDGHIRTTSNSRLTLRSVHRVFETPVQKQQGQKSTKNADPFGNRLTVIIRFFVGNPN